LDTRPVSGSIPVVGAVADHVGLVDVVGGEVGQGAVAAVLGFDQHRPPARTRRTVRMDPFSCLDPGFLIGRQHVLVVAEWIAVEGSGVQVQHPAGFEREVGVAGEDPGPVLPGFDRIGGQPAAHRGSRH
jgi:hypothetical protein